MMKRLICILLTVVLFAGVFTVSAENLMTSNCIYDVSDVLTQSDWETLNSESIELSNKYRCGVYVVLIPYISEYSTFTESVENAAQDIYVRNWLGYGTGYDGVVLLIETSSGKCALASSGARGKYIFNTDALKQFDPSIVSDINARNYSGVISLFIAECRELFEYEEKNGTAYLYNAADPQNDDSYLSGDMLTDCVYDYAGILTADQKSTLEKTAKDISERHRFGVYIYIVDDFTDINSSYDVGDACESVYVDNGFGYGSANRDGIMLFMSMDERDYATYRTYGKGYYSFTEYGLYELEERFLNPFRRNDWYSGFQNYLNYCDYLLDLAEKGTPLDYEDDDDGGYYPPVTPERESYGPLYITTGVFSAIISLVICLILRARMKTAQVKTQANDYIIRNGIRMHDTRDIFTHSTESRTRIDTEPRSSGGHSSGGGHSYSSFSGSHGGGHSGKF